MVRRRQGRILNVGSTSSFQPIPHMAVYGASKSYIMHFTEALHAELRGTDVTATVLSPGLGFWSGLPWGVGRTHKVRCPRPRP